MSCCAYLSDFTCRAPALFLLFLSHIVLFYLKNAEADLSNVVEIWVVDLGPDQTSRWDQWVFIRAENLYWEHSTCEGRVCWSLNRAEEMPVIGLTLPNSDAIRTLSCQ